MLCVDLFTDDEGTRTGYVTLCDVTDNKGNSYVVAKMAIGKYPRNVVAMLTADLLHRRRLWLHLDLAAQGEERVA
eukprot:4894298-Alexandrium_andersonii.AAC.1